MRAAALAALLAPGVAAANGMVDDLFLAVAAHEIGHAAIREFDLPVLASEEAMADAFAVVALHDAMPEEAGRIVAARAAAHLGDGQVSEPFSEYPDDARRAEADLCLLLALDPEAHRAITRRFGMTDDQADGCTDFGAEQARGWRRLIAPLRMPEGARVTEVRLEVDPSLDASERPSDAALEAASDLLASFDWHSLVTSDVAQCDGGAGWARNGRTITICGSHLARLAEDAGRGP